MNTLLPHPLMTACSDVLIQTTTRCAPGHGGRFARGVSFLIIALMAVLGQVNHLAAQTDGTTVSTVEIIKGGVVVATWTSGSTNNPPTFDMRACEDVFVVLQGGGCCSNLSFNPTVPPASSIAPFVLDPVTNLDNLNYIWNWGNGGIAAYHVHLDETSPDEPKLPLQISFTATTTSTCCTNSSTTGALTIVSCSSGTCNAAGSGSAYNKCIDFRFNLGPASWSGDAGYLQIYADTASTNLSTPAALKPPPPQPAVQVITNASGSVQQVWTPLELVNVVVQNNYQYQLQYFASNNVTSIGTNGLYGTNGTPFAVWQVQNPDTNAACNRLWVTQLSPATNQYQYAYFASSNRWDLVEPDGSTTISTWQVPNPNDASITNYYRQISSGGNLLKLTCSVKQFVPIVNGAPSGGLLVLTNIEGFGSVTQTTLYNYYPTNAATGSANRLRRVDNPDGSWKYYIYDGAGRIVTVYSTLGNNPPPTVVTNQPNPTNDMCQETDYNYDPNGINPYVATNTTVKVPVGGAMQVVSTSYNMEQLPGSDFSGTLTGQATQADDPDNPGTVTWYYTANDGVDPAFVGYVKSVSRPDGTASYYTYTLSSSTFTTVEYSGECDNYWGSPYMMDYSDDILDGTKTTTVKDLLGRTLANTVQDIVSGTVLSQENYTYSPSDPRGLDYYLVDLANRTNQYQYACCGLENATDPDGVVTAYGYDSMKRPYNTTVFRGSSYIQTVKTFDGLGRVIGTTTIGTNGSSITVNGYQYDALGRVIRQTNALGGVTITDYGVMNNQRCITNTYPDGGTRIEIYQRDGHLQGVSGTAVSPLNYQYGAELDTDSSWWQYTLEIKLSATGSTNEWVKTYTDAVGNTYKTFYPSATTNVVSFNYYNGGLLTNSIDPDGVSTIYSYDNPYSWQGNYNDPARQKLTVVDIDRNGIGFASNDRITRVSEDVTSDHGFDVNRTQTLVWNTPGQDSSTLVSVVETSTDGLNTWQTAYGDTSTPVTTHTQIAYGANGYRYETTTAPDGSYSVSTYQYGQLMSVNRYDSGNNQIGGTTYGYDAFGRQNIITDARNGTTSLGYNAAGLVATNTTPNPGGGQPETTITSYNNMMLATSVTQPDNTTVTSVYLPTGQLGLQYGSRTYPVGYSYDAQGRVTTMTNWTSFASYAGARVTTWKYDEYRGSLTNKVFDGGASGPAYTYTPAGRLASRAWARGITTTYKYDTAGGLTNVIYSDSTPGVTDVYDRLGRLSTVSWTNITETLTYNLANQILSETNSGGILNGLSVTNGYDADLRRTALAALQSNNPLIQQSFGYDAASRLQTVNDGNNNSASYSYLANSPLVSQIAFKQGSTTRMTTTKQYDYLNRLTAISNAPAAGVPASFGYSYNSANQRTQDTLVDNSYWVYQYDSLGQVISGNKYWRDGTPVAGQQFDYTFDNIGNRTQTQSGGDALGANLRSANYSANSLNQITQRDVPAYLDIKGVSIGTNVVTVNGQTAYRKGEYFRQELPANNSASALWTNIVVTATGQTSVTGNVYVAKTPELFKYDPDGNLTNDGHWAYIWDAENRLVQMTTNSVSAGPQYKLSFAYDPQGRRIQKLVSTNNGSAYIPQYTNRFLYDGWNLITELNPSGSLIRGYMWGTDLSGSQQGAGGVGGLLEVSYHGTTTTNCFPAFDGNGNVVVLVNSADGTVAANYDYGPFGEPIRVTGVMANCNPLLFSTKYYDAESGLYYYGYRYYNPSTGTWPNRDPLENKGGMNLYGYVDNDPIVNVDFLGEESVVGAILEWAPRTIGVFSFDKTIFVIPIAPPAVTLEGHGFFNIEIIQCGCKGLMAKGSVGVRGSIGIGTSVGGNVYDPRLGSGWRNQETGQATTNPENNPGESTGLPLLAGSNPQECKTTIDGTGDIGIDGYASAGWGRFSAGPEFDIHHTFGSDEDPSGWAGHAGIGHGKGSGARIEGYVQGNFEGQVVLTK